MRLLLATIVYCGLVVAHLGKRDRRKGSHNQKPHGSWGPNNPFKSKRAERAKRAADKGRRVAGKRDSPAVKALKEAVAKRKAEGKGDGVEKGMSRPSGRDRKSEEVVVRGASGAKAQDIAKRSSDAENFLAGRFPELSSRWKGIVDTAPQEKLGHFAVKRWTCSIGMSEEAEGGMIKRDETMLHEMIHAYSPDRDKPEQQQHYRAQPGWEEAVVEMQNRLNYPDFLRHKGEPEDEVEWRTMIANDTRFKTHPYNRFIEPLEKVRKAMRMQPKKFYDELLHTPASERESFLRDKARSRYRDKDYERFGKIGRLIQDANIAMYRG